MSEGMTDSTTNVGDFYTLLAVSVKCILQIRIKVTLLFDTGMVHQREHTFFSLSCQMPFIRDNYSPAMLQWPCSLYPASPV